MKYFEIFNTRVVALRLIFHLKKGAVSNSRYEKMTLAINNLIGQFTSPKSGEHSMSKDEVMNFGTRK